MFSSAPKQRYLLLSRPAVAALLLWALSLTVLLTSSPGVAALALSGGVYAALLGGLTLWLIPRRPPALADDGPRAPSDTLLTPGGVPGPPDGVLRAASTGLPLLLQRGVVAAAGLWTVAFGVAAGGWHVPLLTQLLAGLSRVRLAPHLGGLVLHNFLSLAVIPGVLLLALGMRPRELGLCAPAPGSWRATLACLVVPLGFVVWAFAGRGLTVAALGYWLLHNLLSNGFSEEFFARGMILSHLRARLTSGWALVAQALIFALLHAAAEVPARHAHVAGVLAEVVALNFPTGIALGVMAVRSRSLLMPSFVHVSLDTMKDLLS